MFNYITNSNATCTKCLGQPYHTTLRPSLDIVSTAFYAIRAQSFSMLTVLWFYTRTTWLNLLAARTTRLVYSIMIKFDCKFMLRSATVAQNRMEMGSNYCQCIVAHQNHMVKSNRGCWHSIISWSTASSLQSASVHEPCNQMRSWQVAQEPHG